MENPFSQQYRKILSVDIFIVFVLLKCCQVFYSECLTHLSPPPHPNKKAIQNSNSTGENEMTT